MLLAFGIVLFTIAVYMGLEAVTVRQKQVAGSLRARPTLRRHDAARDGADEGRHRPRRRPRAARKLADLAHGAADDAEPRRDPPPPDRGRLDAPPHADTFLAVKGAGIVGSVFLGLVLAGSRPAAGRQRAALRARGGAGSRSCCPTIVLGRLDAHAPHEDMLAAAARGARPPAASRSRPASASTPRSRRSPSAARARCSRSSRSCCTRCASARAASRRSRTSPSALDMPETTTFARSIIQADQLGMSLGRILRVQARTCATSVRWRPRRRP